MNQSNMGESLQNYRTSNPASLLAWLRAPRMSTTKQSLIASDVKLTDVSFWQGKIDFLKMRFGNIAGTIIRAGQNTWEDINWKTNWSNAKKANLPRGSYWFYDSRTHPHSQADQYAALLLDDPGEMMVLADYEENYQGPHRGWEKLYDFIERLKKNGIPQNKIWIYTGFWYWLDHSPQRDAGALNYFAQFPLHLAYYTSDPASVRIPKPWSDTQLWQYGTPAIGNELGVSSSRIDMNQWNGDIGNFLNYWNFSRPPAPQPHMGTLELDGKTYDVTERL